LLDKKNRDVIRSTEDTILRDAWGLRWRQRDGSDDPFIIQTILAIGLRNFFVTTCPVFTRWENRAVYLL